MYVPTWPPLSPLLALRRENECKVPFPFYAPHKTYAYLARGLIYNLVKNLHLGARNVVLAPDYHHGNEVAAIRAAGARVKFYRTMRDLSPDLDDLERLATPDVRALLVIHYMGWAQRIEPFVQLARRKDLVLIEDCALSLFAEHEGRPVGSFGDYSIFCLYKTLPVPNGGLLVQNRNVLEAMTQARLELTPPSPLSVAGRSAELMLEGVTARAEGIGRALFRAKHAIGSALSAARVEREPVGDVGFDTARANLAISPFAERLLARIDFEGIAERRRLRFNMLADQLAGGTTPLKSHAEAGSCPLFFPLLVADKRAACEALNRRGIGAVEFWNTGDRELDPRRASEAEFLRRHVVELPIHQEVEPEQIREMARAVLELGLGLGDERTAASRPAASIEIRPDRVELGDTRRAPRSRLPRRAPEPIRPATTVSVELLRSIDPIAPLAREWNELCDEGPCEPPFFRPEWISAYLGAFEPRANLMLLTARRGGRLRAVLPLIEERTFFLGLPVRRLRYPANIHSCRVDLIHGSGDEEPVARAMWDWLKSLEHWDLFEVRDVPEGATTRSLLSFAREEGWPTGQWESMRSPYLPLEHDAHAFTTAKFRSNLRRRRRKLEATGRVELRRIERADEALLRSFYALERSGWKGAAGSAIAQNDPTRRFYDSIAEAAAEKGQLCFYVLDVDGRPIAMQYGLVAHGQYFLSKPAYDENYHEYSPGQLLMEKVVSDCIARGFKEFDFLGMWMPWKAEWTIHYRRHDFCYVFHKGAYGSALHAAKFKVVPFAKARLLKRAPAVALAPAASGRQSSAA